MISVSYKGRSDSSPPILRPLDRRVPFPAADFSVIARRAQRDYGRSGLDLDSISNIKGFNDAYDRVRICTFLV